MIETKVKVPFLPLQFNSILQVLSSTVSQEKEITFIQIVKEEMKLSLFTDRGHDCLGRKLCKTYQKSPGNSSEYKNVTHSAMLI